MDRHPITLYDIDIPDPIHSTKGSNMWFIYLLRCCDNSLYSGITNDLKRRLRAHRDGVGAKYTRSRLPLRLVYYELRLTKSEALKREIEIKGMRKSEKEDLILNLPINEEIMPVVV
jgi:putative endonuclease